MAYRERLGFRSLLFVSLLLVGCSPAPNPHHADHRNASFSPVAITITGIPKLDGSSVDWSKQVPHVPVLNGDSPHRLPTAQFDAQLYLGWNDNGLLVFVDVTDNDIRESNSDLEPWNGASVELYQGNATGKEHWHVTISPGVDPAYPQMRLRFNDDRSKAFRSDLHITAVAQKTARGYTLEAQLPWELVKLQPNSDRECAFAVRINKLAAGQVAHLFWPRPWPPSNNAPANLWLDDHPDEPVAAAATAIDADYDRFHRVRISIATTIAPASSISLRINDTVLSQTALHTDGRLKVGEIFLPVPVVSHPYPAMDVMIGDAKVGSIKLPSYGELLAQAANDLEVVANPSVFNQRNLPEIDFSSPPAAEDILGNYSIHTTYYDSLYNVVTHADMSGRYGAVVDVTPAHGKPFKRLVTLYRAPTEFDLRPLHLPATMPLPAKFGVDEAIANEQAAATSDFLVDSMRASARRDSNLAIYLAGLSELSPSTGELPRRLGPAGRDLAWWYGLRQKLGLIKPYKYLLHLPQEIASRPASEPVSGRKYPLIVFLHGVGERGTTLSNVAKNGLPKIINKDWPYANQFIIVSPQCPPRELWNPLQIRDLIDQVTESYPVDADRIYLTGLSMGGIGTWETIEWFPEKFAAAAVVCGAGDPMEALRLKDLPIWVFHGGVDPTVHIGCAHEMVRALRDVHGRVRFTVYPEFGHNSWVPAYDEDRLYDWLLQQRRGQPAQPPVSTAGTQPDP